MDKIAERLPPRVMYKTSLMSLLFDCDRTHTDTMPDTHCAVTSADMTRSLSETCNCPRVQAKLNPSKFFDHLLQVLPTTCLATPARMPHLQNTVSLSTPHVHDLHHTTTGCLWGPQLKGEICLWIRASLHVLSQLPTTCLKSCHRHRLLHFFDCQSSCRHREGLTRNSRTLRAVSGLVLSRDLCSVFPLPCQFRRQLLNHEHSFPETTMDTALGGCLGSIADQTSCVRKASRSFEPKKSVFKHFSNPRAAMKA